MSDLHGQFCWYELLTDNADAAQAFYSAVLGWTFERSAMPDMDYRLFSAAGVQVGGLLSLTAEMKAAGAQPCWLGYIAVDDCDVSAARISAAGGSIHVPPTDIPGIGRFALVTDPQGVMIYIMQDTSGQASHSFAGSEGRNGHCAWNELATTDPAAAFAFYAAEFGWEKDGAMDMGAMGLYEFLKHGQQGVIGAVMLKPAQMPAPFWTYYFRVADIDAAVARVKAGGGQILFGPEEVPGGVFVINGIDPQGAHFALVGPRG